MELRLLGAGLARPPGGAALTGLGAKGMAMLAYLAMQPGRTATRDVLVSLLWSQGSSDQGRASLRQELRRMKRAMGDLFDQTVETPGGQIALRPGTVITDLEKVEAACAARDTAGLSALLDHYGGPLLAPLAVPEAEFQDWVATRNSHIETAVEDGLLRLMLLDENAGRLDRAAAAARKLLDMDPLQEDVHAALVRINVAAGRISQARKAADACRRLFEAELGVPPEVDLDALIPSARHGRADPAPGRAPSRAHAPGRRHAPAAALLPTARVTAQRKTGKTAVDPQGSAELGGEASTDLPPLVVILPAEGSDEAREIAAEAIDEALSQISWLSWMRIRGPETLASAGLRPADLAQAADYAVTLRVAPGDSATAELFNAARRGDSATVASRRIAWPEGNEISPASGLSRSLAGALAAELTDAELRAVMALDEAAAQTTPWRRLMRARGLVLRGGPKAAWAARALLDPVVRQGEASAAELCVLGASHLEEAWSGWSDTPREALFRGRELALRALKRAPADPWPQQILGSAAMLMGDTDSARAHQLRALTLAPGFWQAMGDLALLMAMAGDVEEADAWTDRALALSPGDAQAASWLRAPALARFAAGDWAGALAATERAIAARPDGIHARLLRAACLTQLDRADEAADLVGPHARRLERISEEALRMAHPFEDPTVTELLLAPLQALRATV